MKEGGRWKENEYVTEAVVVTTAVSQSFTAICLNIHKCFMHPKMPCTRDMASH